jgi:imidazole glycerol-phosphate synthase subunit HisH
VSRRTIGIVDYGAGNLSSVQHALHMLGHRCRISGDTEVLDGCNLLLLPGVGAFPRAMENLIASGLDRYVVEAARNDRPLLGICLGMQLLVDASSEYRMTAGLGLIPGNVGPIEGEQWHIGWNRLETVTDDPMFRLSDRESFYFNHSYALDVPPVYQAALARNGRPLVAAIRRDNVVGLQFHAEKSQSAGRVLLAAIIEGLCP